MDAKIRVLLMFLIICNTLLLLFLTNLTLGTRADLNNLQTTLVTKSDLLTMKQTSSEDVLQKNCGRCHSESRFASFHGSEAELLGMIEQMQSMTGSQISSGDVDKIHASLELLQCNTCHEQYRLRALGLKSEEERKEIIRQMLEKTTSAVEREAVNRLNQSYQQLFGF